jgi:hypothetical protein
MLKTQLYEVVTNSEGMDGSGYDFPIGYFNTEAEAKFFGKGKGVMGSQAKSRLTNVYYDKESGICCALKSAFVVEDLSEQVKAAQIQEKESKIAILQAELDALES